MTPGDRLVELLGVMSKLRAECEWKREQTHRSLARYLLEETHETLEAIDSGDLDHLREELGDLLLQVYFHAEIARENGVFDLDDVAGDLIDKMKRRNPHVYGDAPGGSAVQINELWQQIKASEKQRTSPYDGIPPTLPALLYADKVLDRLQRDRDQTLAELVETPVGLDNLDRRDSAVIGDQLLALVAEAREANVDPEQALRDAVRRLATDPDS
jgi:XTP/dITP diphosphohydrolase